MTDKKYILESILFAAGDSVGLKQLSEAIEETENETKALLYALGEEYENTQRGLVLLETGNSFQLATRDTCFPYIKRVLESYNTAQLSPAALETLAIIAYRQPIPRAEIEQVRGVHSSSSLNVLIDRNLVECAGKLDLPGKPMGYRTTDDFLRFMNIRNLSELEDFESFREGIQLALDEQDEQK